MSKSSNFAPKNPSESLKICSLDDYFLKGNSLTWGLARVLAAIATDDKVVSPAELDILMEFSRQSSSPALVGGLIFATLEERLKLSATLDDLKKCAIATTREQRHAAFESALPLIGLQGSKAPSLKKKLAGSLGERTLPNLVENSEEWTFLDSFYDYLNRLMRKRDLADDVLTAAELIGDLALIDAYRAHRKNKSTDLQQFLDEVVLRLEKIEAELKISKDESAAARLFVANSEAFVEQVLQRLQLLKERMTIEKEQFAEDIDEIVADVGAVMESFAQDRLMTDDWKKSQVWESMARTSWGLLAENKINRVIGRLNARLRLYEKDLSIFEKEIKTTSDAIIRNEHYSRFDGLERPLKFLTIIEEIAHDVSEKTLWATALGMIGLGAVAIALGPASVVPIISGPAAMKVFTLVGGMGFFKWFSSPESRRKYAAIKDKRAAFEGLIRERLEAARKEYEIQLDVILQSYSSTAAKLVTPVALEAAAMRYLPFAKRKVLEYSISHARGSLKKIQHRDC